MPPRRKEAWCGRALNCLLIPTFPGSASSSSFHMTADREATCDNVTSHHSHSWLSRSGRKFWTDKVWSQELSAANWFCFPCLFICLLVCFAIRNRRMKADLQSKREIEADIEKKTDAHNRGKFLTIFMSLVPVGSQTQPLPCLELCETSYLPLWQIPSSA